MKKKLKVLLSAVAVSLFLAACGNSADPVPTDTPTPTTAATEAPKDAPTTAPAPTEATATEAPTPTVTPTPAPPATPRPDISGVSLKEIYKDYFMIGTIYARTIDSGKDNELIKQHFNVITPENLMKPEYMQNPEGTFHFQVQDYMVELAEKNGHTVIGHTLAWHSQSGDFLGIKTTPLK